MFARPPFDLTDKEAHIKERTFSFGLIGLPGETHNGGNSYSASARAICDRSIDRTGIVRQILAIECAEPRDEALADLKPPLLVIHGAQVTLIILITLITLTLITPLSSPSSLIYDHCMYIYIYGYFMMWLYPC